MPRWLRVLPRSWRKSNGDFEHSRKEHVNSKTSITTMAADWSGMELSSASSLTTAKGDILIGLRSRMEISEGYEPKQALILLEDNAEGSRSRHARGIT